MSDNYDFNVPEDYVKDAQGALTGGQISLPFDTLILRWRNGSGSYANSEIQTLFFGGWECGSDSMETMTNAYGVKVPQGFVEFEATSKTGSNYGAYANRVVLVSFIGKRKRWVEGSSHAQWLVYLADFIDKKYTPWAPAILTAKGYSCKYIEDAISQWGTKTASARREFADGLPEFLFYAPLGTFGDKPDTKMVGKGGNQSPITPCQLIIPPNVDADFLKRTFIGNEIAEKCSDMLSEANAWLKAWDEDQPEIRQPDSGDDYFGGSTNDELPDNEVPF